MDYLRVSSVRIKPRISRPNSCSRAHPDVSFFVTGLDVPAALLIAIAGAVGT
jgi:hypothetical protein